VNFTDPGFSDYDCLSGVISEHSFSYINLESAWKAIVLTTEKRNNTFFIRKVEIEMPEKQMIPTSQVLPNKICIIPLTGKPIFPGIFMPLMVPSPEDINTVEKSLSGDGFIGLVLTHSAEAESVGGDDLFKVGTAAKIIRKVNLPDGGINIFISTLKRFRIKRLIQKEKPISAAAEYLDDENFDSDEVRALTRALISEMKQISENNPLFSEEMRLNMV